MYFKGLFTVSTVINPVRYVGRCADQHTHVALRLILS